MGRKNVQRDQAHLFLKFICQSIKEEMSLQEEQQCLGRKGNLGMGDSGPEHPQNPNSPTEPNLQARELCSRVIH